MESYFYSKIWTRGVSRRAKQSIHLLLSRAVSLSHPSLVPHIFRLPIAPPPQLLPKLTWRKKPIAASERRTSPQIEIRNAKHVVNPGGVEINPRFLFPRFLRGPMPLFTAVYAVSFVRCSRLHYSYDDDSVTCTRPSSFPAVYCFGIRGPCSCRWPSTTTQLC